MNLKAFITAAALVTFLGGTALASPTLSKNSRGEDVLTLQKKLYLIGYDISELDGIYGIEGSQSRNITVQDCEIYECSMGAVFLVSCYDTQIIGCDIRDCGGKDGYGADRIIRAERCYGVTAEDCHVFGNICNSLVFSVNSQQVYLLGTLFEKNIVSSSCLETRGEPITVAGSEFRDEAPIFIGGESAAAADGNDLSKDALSVMHQEHIDFAGFRAVESVPLYRAIGSSGLWEVHVSNVDELLAAIAPDTVIYLEEGEYDLTTASCYGSCGGQYYRWQQEYDGPCLVISGVTTLFITGPGADSCRIVTDPRYADVLRFDDCYDLHLSGFTAGHTQGASSCMGSVLHFNGGASIHVEDCGLFGCGILGIEAHAVEGIEVKNCEIYECSFGAVQLSLCVDGIFQKNDIHDCAYPTYFFSNCQRITVDGKQVAEESITLPEAGPYKSASAN